MPAAKTQQQQIDTANESILVIIGRLLEATKAASDGIKTLSDESKANSSTIQALQAQIASNTQVLQQLDKIIRTGNGDSMITQLKLLTESHQQHIEDDNEAHKTIQELLRRIEELEKYRDRQGTHANMIWWVVGAVGWLITTGIALYAAIKGK